MRGGALAENQKRLATIIAFVLRRLTERSEILLSLIGLFPILFLRFFSQE
jgi:hypothetical protein